MSILVLDGYNVIHAIPHLDRKLDQSLQAAREALVADCVALRQRRRDLRQIYVVFDGDQRYGEGPDRRREGITVLFTTRSEEADERILNFLRHHAATGTFTIVSNDTELFNNCRAHGARMMSVAQFAAQLNPPKTTHRASVPSQDKEPLSQLTAREITEAYLRALEQRPHPQ